MQTALVIIHVIIAVVLTAIVLMQHGRQQGLSGAIAGGAETFFGKNKGRTVDAMLKKFTAVVAILFIISSVVLTTVSIKAYDTENAEVETETEGDEQATEMQIDENGNLLNEDGSLMTDNDGNPININQLQSTEAEAEVSTDEEAAEGTTESAEEAEGAAEGSSESLDDTDAQTQQQSADNGQ